MIKIFKYFCLLLILIILTSFLTFKITHKPATIDLPKTKSLVETIDNANYYVNGDKSIYVVISSKHLKFLYSGFNPSPLNQTCEDNRLTICMNASYFIGPSTNAKPAGLLIIDGKHYSQLAHDKQLTHIVSYSLIKNKLEFTLTNDFKLEQSNSNFIFQTGPQLIEKGSIKSDLIEESLNGNGKYLRSALGYTSNDKIFLAISRYDLTLIDFSKRLIELPIFQNISIDAVNLDGGSSTSMFSKINSEFNFKAAKILPLVIGI